ncbi:UNVERIFIED_ORG: hypothetical protein M2402_003766 [Rahnella aquatilis]
MKKTRYTQEQIAFALKQAETGTTNAAAAMTGPSRSGYGRLQKPALVMVCSGSISCCGARAGWLTTKKPIGFTVWKG